MSNAYENALLIVTPNAYKASKIYALKPTDGSGDLSFTRAGSKMRRNSAGLWETIGANIPPLNYPVGGGCPSWLFEAEATCLIPASNLFIGDCTKTTGITDSPISGLTSVRITKTSASAQYVVSSYSATITNATPYGASVYFKYDGHDIDSSLEFNSGGDFGIGWKADIEIRAGGITISSTTSCTAVLVAEANGWYRLEVALTSATVTNNSGSVLIKAVGASGATFLITTSNLTQETSPSSPILTTGSNLTRFADKPLSITTPLLLNDFSIYMKFNLSKVNQALGFMLLGSIDSALISRIYIDSAASMTFDVGASSTSIGTSGLSINADYKICFTRSGTTLKYYRNGALIGTFTVNSGAFNLTSFCNGVDSGGDTGKYITLGNFSEGIAYETALSGTEAENLTAL
jgi:hypothetical protein